MAITDNGKTGNEDFEYILQDLQTVYIGARYSYEKLYEEEQIPFKLKAILRQHITKEISKDTTLESHFYYMTKDDFSYEVYSQLRVKVKVGYTVVKKNIFGKEINRYEYKLFPIKNLVEINLAQKKARGYKIEEILVSKLGLMTFVL